MQKQWQTREMVIYTLHNEKNYNEITMKRIILYSQKAINSLFIKLFFFI